MFRFSKYSRKQEANRSRRKKTQRRPQTGGGGDNRLLEIKKHVQFLGQVPIILQPPENIRALTQRIKSW